MTVNNIQLLLKLCFWLDADNHTCGIFCHENGDTDGIGYYVLLRGGSLPDVSDITYRVTGNLKDIDRATTPHCDHVLEVLDYVPMLDDKKSVELYLTSLKGIGPKKAKVICDELGVMAVDKIEADYKVLTKIKGISEKIALSIKEQIADYNKFQLFRSFMLPYGMSGDFVAQAYADRKKSASKRDIIDYYRLYPYALMNVRGANFPLVDAMALSLGYTRDCAERKYRAAYAVFKHESSKGHTALYINDFCYLYTQMTGGDTVTYEEIITDCKCYGVKIRKSDGTPDILIETQTQHRYEQECIDKLYTCMGIKPIIPAAHIDGIKDRYPHLDEDQAQAVYNALTASVSCITGGPGTGKTTVIKTIIKEYKSAGYDKIMLLAPTGKAARRMEESTGYRAMTVHKGLKFRPDEEASELKEDVEADLIIIDEMSMVDFENFSKLMRRIKSARLLFVGDNDQLLSVGAGKIFRDILISVATLNHNGLNKIRYKTLQQNHRQGAGSVITANAKKINASDPAIYSDADFVYDWQDTNQKISKAVIDTYMAQVEKYGIDEVAVLSPVKKGEAGVFSFNSSIQARINPPAEDKPQILHHGEFFRLGDVVMQTANSEDAVNGDIGRIIDVDLKDNTLTVEYSDNRIVKYTKGAMADLTLAYAMTVHKSQGSEYKSVIYCMPVDMYAGMKVKNIPYTAITRAKEHVTYVGTWADLCNSILTVAPTNRVSAFAYLLTTEFNRYTRYTKTA